MNVQTNCPACGAQITIPDEGGSITCPYCSTHFQVSMEGTQPSFKVASMVEEMAAEPPPAEQPPSEPPVSNIDVFNPPPAESVSPVFPPPEKRLFGGRLWLVVAIAASSIFCLACLCMFVIFRTVFIK